MDKHPTGLLIALGRASKEHDPDAKDEHDEEDMKRSAMDDFIAAVHSKDCEAALSAWDDLCQMDHKEEGEQEEQD